VPWKGAGDAPAPPARLHKPDRACYRSRRILLQAEGKRQVEQHLGVGGALDLRVQGLVDREHQVALDRREAVDEPVVHE
jgi:hypothetical protein